MKNKNLVQVSDSIIYIMSDGVNSKIGITSNLQNRVSTYKTHNPTATLFSHYICPKAKDIESAIKNLFKDKTITSSKEWFNLNPNYLDRIVSLLVNGDNNTHLDIIPAMNHVPLHDDFCRLFSKNQKIEVGDKYFKAIEIFAREFNLGIPKHRLPDSVIKIEGMPIDIYECRNKSLTHRMHETNKIKFQDHRYAFYHLVNLTSGKQIAFCTSFVSMPYPGNIGETQEEKRENFEKTIYPQIIEDARDRGYYVFRHDDWSWHNRGETFLLLIIQKTPVSKKLGMWENSFRKWVIEREKVLEQEDFEDIEALVYAIEDICGDATFPLHIQGAEDFAKHIDVHFRIDYYNKESFPLRDAFDFLFSKWKGVKWIPRIEKTDNEEAFGDIHLNGIKPEPQINQESGFDSFNYIDVEKNLPSQEDLHLYDKMDSSSYTKKDSIDKLHIIEFLKTEKASGGLGQSLKFKSSDLEAFQRSKHLPGLRKLANTLKKGFEDKIDGIKYKFTFKKSNSGFRAYEMIVMKGNERFHYNPYYSQNKMDV